MNKKTIFLLPLDLKGKKQTRITPKFIRDVYNADKVDVLPEHLQKKKKNIFTVELNRLIGKISEKNKPNVEAIQIAAKDVLPESFTILNKIYAGEDSILHANNYLKSMFQSYGIKAYSFFFYEQHTFTYFPVFAEGISERARTNLLFQSHDKFLQNRTEGYIHLYFQPVLINDIFFKKKLSIQEINNYSSIVLKFLDVHKLPGLIAFFYEKDINPGQDEIETLCEKIDKDIEPLVPFLNSVFQSELNTRLDSYDFLRKIIHGIHIQTRYFQNGFYFSKLQITNFLKVEDAQAKKKSFILMLKNHLLAKEGIIEISPNELIIITKENEVEKIMSYISENVKTDFQFKINSLKYPENGKNLYLYF